jgi:hypothetical protein
MATLNSGERNTICDKVFSTRVTKPFIRPLTVAMPDGMFDGDKDVSSKRKRIYVVNQILKKLYTRQIEKTVRTLITV